jgi:DNA polymerase delta subunit 3
MLYDFHRWQNAMRPGTVHATYLVYGTKRPENTHDGDVEMTSSAPDSDVLSEDVPTFTITLVQEARLEGEIASQHYLNSSTNGPKRNTVPV